MHKNKRTSLLVTVLLTLVMSIHGSNISGVFFSYNRPMQLFSYLESLEKYVTGLSSMHVIYRASNNEFEQAYEFLKFFFPYVSFIKQTNPPHDFKEYVIKTVFQDTASPYVIFGVDDIIVTDFIDMHECVKQLEKHKSHSFHLRMGKNINRSYRTTKKKQKKIKRPKLRHVGAGVFTWKFKRGSDGWRMPNPVDMTIVRKDDIKHNLVSYNYASPWDLEGALGKQANLQKWGLCYEYSKLVNIPMNLVATHQDKNMNLFSPEQLLFLFNHRIKIDIQPFFRIRNNATHMEYVPTFVEIEKGLCAIDNHDKTGYIGR